LKKFFLNSTLIKQLVPGSTQTIYDEIQSPILYGLLAHSHNWKKNSTTVKNIAEKIRDNDLITIKKPIEMPDIICIADTGCWSSAKSPGRQTGIVNGIAHPCMSTAYMCEQLIYSTQVDPNKIIKPIASAIKGLMRKLSKEHPGLLSLSKYFVDSIPSGGGGPMREWLIKEVYSERNQIELEKVGNYPDYYFPYEWRFLA
jgi:hypothetical protein